MIDRSRQRFDSYLRKVKDRKETTRLERLRQELDAAIAERRKPAAAAPAGAAPAPATDPSLC
jgi:hypothetical protein